MPRKSLLAAALLTAAALAGPIACKAGGADPAAAVTPGTALGIDTAAMDRTVEPGDDFFAFANGAWVKNTEIPADRSSIGGFYIAQKQTEANLEALMRDLLAARPETGSDAERIRNYYTAYMDTAAIDAAGLAPVRAELDRIAAIEDVAGLSRELGAQLRADVDPLNATDFQTENLFGVFVTQALAGGEVLPYLLQGGLGMPEREYYLSADPKMVELRGKYKAYIAQLLSDAGIADAAAKAQRIYDLETRIAQAHATREQSEDFRNNAAEWARGDFASKAPGIDWDAFFAAARFGDQQKFAAYHAGAIPKLSALVASQPLEAWKDWLAFHRINQNADVLGSKLDATRFGFYGAALQGTQAQRPRAKRALAAVDAALGDAMGKLYVDKFFPAAAKAQVEDMVGNIKAAFAKRVERVDTLAPETKREALAKVRTIEVGVGYPDAWRDYGALTVDPKNAYANRQAAEQLDYAQQLAKIGKPLDKREWWMNAQLVNAVNLPVQNALNFPAAILQRPFFDPTADPAFNYGAIGAVIGHEISHSFDNNGAQFDSTGRMRNWWTAADLKRFNEAGDALVAQYDAYRPFPDLAVNGRLTLGENIADVVGLQAAYDAYRASLGGKQAPVIDGFSGDQRFFIAYAQSWASKMRDEALRGRIATDGHAPGQYRAQTVRNIDAWYEAFDVEPGDKLYLPPEQRVRIWG